MSDEYGLGWTIKTYGENDHVTDRGAAMVTTQSLCQTLAGARIRGGQTERGTECFWVGRIGGTIDWEGVGGEKRDVGSEKKDDLKKG